MNARKVVYTLLGLLTLATGTVTIPLPSTGPDLNLPIKAMTITDGYAARWNTCTLTYSVNPAHAPAGAVSDFVHATQIMTKATGVRFTRVGDNSVVLQHNDVITLTGHAGEPKMMIGWARPARSAHKASTPTSNMLDGTDVAAKTEDYSKFRGRRGIVAPAHHIQGATVLIDAIRGNGAGKSGQLGTDLHELGHVIGLGHTGDSSSVMYYYGVPNRGYLSAEDTLALRDVAPTNCR